MTHEPHAYTAASFHRKFGTIRAALRYCRSASTRRKLLVLHIELLPQSLPDTLTCIIENSRHKEYRISPPFVFAQHSPVRLVVCGSSCRTEDRIFGTRLPGILGTRQASSSFVLYTRFFCRVLKACIFASCVTFHSADCHFTTFTTRNL